MEYRSKRTFHAELHCIPSSLQEVVASHPPRLFQCSNASGHFNVEEIFDFSQEVGSV